jgi:hypothetical protein
MSAPESPLLPNSRMRIRLTEEIETLSGYASERHTSVREHTPRAASRDRYTITGPDPPLPPNTRTRSPLIEEINNTSQKRCAYDNSNSALYAPSAQLQHELNENVVKSRTTLRPSSPPNTRIWILLIEEIEDPPASEPRVFCHHNASAISSYHSTASQPLVPFNSHVDNATKPSSGR